MSLPTIAIDLHAVVFELSLIPEVPATVGVRLTDLAQRVATMEYAYSDLQTAAHLWREVATNRIMSSPPDCNVPVKTQTHRG